MQEEPLDPPSVRALVRAILATGSVNFSKHALEEMDEDKLTETDCTNVLRGGVVQPGEFRDGTWRYCVCTKKIEVVVAFRSETTLVVVTAWRIK